MPEVLTHTNGQLKSELLPTPRSEEVQDIMGRIPNWVTRWGISLMAFLSVGILVGAGMFKYPDIIPAQVTISSANPPVKIIARNSLPIKSIFVEDGDVVEEGQILCILSCTGNYSDVTAISILANKIDTAVNLCEITTGVKALPLNLGELQGEYITLLQAIIAYRFFLQHNGYSAKIEHIIEQSSVQSQLSAHLKRNDGRYQEQLTMQEQRFQLDSSLVAQTIMSGIEYEAARKELLNQRMSTESNTTTVLQSKLKEKEIQKDLSDATIQFQKDENDYVQKIRDAAKTFKGSYAKWEQNYVLHSPVSGKVVFFKYWKENQFVQAGDAVMMITPPIQSYVARGSIKVAGAGKVEPGQKVLIKLLAYPYEEYGGLRGVLKSKSAVAMDTSFSVEISLINGLNTNSQRIIAPQAQIDGVAEITTESKSLLQRLFENVYSKRKR